MYGLAITKNCSRAEIVSRDRAETAVQRLLFVVGRRASVRVKPIVKCGCMQGYGLKLEGNEGEHWITETDMERFGL